MDHEDEDISDLELDFYRSDEESSDSSEDLNVHFHGEVRDVDEEGEDDEERGGDGGGESDEEVPGPVGAYGVEYGNVQFGLYEPLAGPDDLNNMGDAGELDQPDNGRLLTLNWCDCGHCEHMDSFTAGDCVCCREIPEVATETDKYGSACITTTEAFEPAILHPISLYIGWLDYTDRWRQAARSFGVRNNEKYRYVAYRKLVRWCWGWLGKDIRVQTPACAHSRIMKAYPDGGNNYKGTVLHPLVID